MGEGARCRRGEAQHKSSVHVLGRGGTCAAPDHALRRRIDCGSLAAMSCFRWPLHILPTLAVVLAGVVTVDVARIAAEEIPAVASRQRAERKIFTDSEITEGFFKRSEEHTSELQSPA